MDRIGQVSHQRSRERRPQVLLLCCARVRTPSRSNPSRPARVRAATHLESKYPPRPANRTRTSTAVPSARVPRNSRHSKSARYVARFREGFAGRQFFSQPPAGSWSPRSLYSSRSQRKLDDRGRAINDASPAPAFVVGGREVSSLTNARYYCSEIGVRVYLSAISRMSMSVVPRCFGDHVPALVLARTWGTRPPRTTRNGSSSRNFPKEAHQSELGSLTRLLASARPLSIGPLRDAHQRAWRRSISSCLTCAAASCPRPLRPSRSAYRRGVLTTGTPRYLSARRRVRGLVRKKRHDARPLSVS